jgi:hypothetical protein
MGWRTSMGGSADLRERAKGSYGSCAATPDRGGKQVTKFPFGEVLDGQVSDDIGVFAAQGAAGLFHLFSHHALARFKVGEAFAVGLLGHVHRSFDGLPAVLLIGRRVAVCNPWPREVIMNLKVPLCGTMISLPVPHRRKDKAPFGGAAPLPGRGDAARNRCARKYARPWPFCNAPYARVLRRNTLCFEALAKDAASPSGSQFCHTGSFTPGPSCTMPLDFLAFFACAAADSGIS